MIEHRTIPASRRSNGSLSAVLLLVCACGLCGCQMIAEKCDTASIPPNYSHDFMTPSCYGYFTTQWQQWPCDNDREGPAERRRAKKKAAEEIKEGDTDTLPPPSEESTEEPSNSMDLPNDLLPLPESGTPAFPPPGETPEGTPSDLLPPSTPGDLPSATPKTEGEMPGEPGAETPGAAEPLPERLIPDDTVPAKQKASPDKGAWDLETLPLDAPQGSLVVERSQNSGGSQPQTSRLPSKNGQSAPTLAPERIENARRPALRGASSGKPPAAPRTIPGAGANYQENASTVRRAHVPADAFDDSDAVPSRPATNDAQQGPELRPQPIRGAAISRPMPIDSAVVPASTTAERPADDWRPSRSRAGKRMPERRADGWQSDVPAGEYPGRRTSYTGTTQSDEARPATTTSSKSANPLR